MTDKIIIDGVDVSGCKYLCGSIIDYQCKINDFYLCVDCDNCAHKQLKRKEEECEKFDQEAQEYHNTILKLDDEIKLLRKQLQAEKEKVEKLEKKFKRFFNIDNQECWDLAFMNDEKEKYKQALEEIKGIAKASYDGFGNNVYETDVKAILQKCEVLKDKLW